VWPRFLVDALNGKTSLAKVFWLYGLGGSVGYKVLGWILEPTSPVAAAIYLLGGLGLGFLQCAMLWQCAYNSRVPFLGRVIRTCIIVSLLTLPLLLYDILKNPQAWIAS
jgi:hypothetical protein